MDQIDATMQCEPHGRMIIAICQEYDCKRNDKVFSCDLCKLEFHNECYNIHDRKSIDSKLEESEKKINQIMSQAYNKYKYKGLKTVINEQLNSIKSIIGEMEIKQREEIKYYNIRKVTQFNRQQWQQAVTLINFKETTLNQFHSMERNIADKFLEIQSCVESLFQIQKHYTLRSRLFYSPANQQEWKQVHNENRVSEYVSQEFDYWRNKKYTFRIIRVCKSKIANWDNITLIQLFSVEQKICKMKCSADSTYVACLLEDNTIEIWNLITGREEGYWFRRESGRINGFDYSSDNKWLITTSYDKPIVIHEISTHKIREIPSNQKLQCNYVQFSPSGQYFFTAFQNSYVLIWKIVSIDQIVEQVLINIPPNAVVIYSFKDQYILSYHPERGMINIWNALNGRLVTQSKKPSFSRIRITQDNKYIFILHSDCTLSMSFLMNFKQIYRYRFNPPIGNQMQISPNTQLLANHQINDLRIWNLETKQWTQIPMIYKSDIQYEFTKDNRLFIVAADDNIRVYHYGNSV